MPDAPSAELSHAACRFDAVLARQSEAARHIRLADTPFFEGEWIDRYYPSAHQDDIPLDAESAWTLIRANQRHTTLLLEGFGIKTAESYSVPVQKQLYGEQRWVIRSLVQLVDGHPFQPRTSWNEQTVHLDQAAHVAEKLVSYLAWVQSTRPKVYNWDIGKISQFVATDRGEAIRVDIDPTIAEPTDELLFDTITDVQRMVKSLPRTDIAQEMRINLGNMMLKIHPRERIGHWL